MKYFFVLISLLTALQLHAQHDVPATSGFEVMGAVKHRLKLSVNDLLDMHPDQLGDVTVHNHGGDEKSVAHNLKGILLKTILDSAAITAGKPKEYSELVICLVASDGYRNVYSWNELFNTDVGNHVYIITEMDGERIDQMHSRILAMSLADTNTGRRHLKGLARVEVKKVP